METSIASLKVGEKGTIEEISLEYIPLALLEMGCMPGESVELVQRAPLNDPLYIRVGCSHMAIRQDTACKIMITKV